MSAKEKEAPSSSSSSLELHPLRKDLTEKMLSFRKHVVSLLAELKDVRNRLASQEESFIKESQSRKVAEMKAASMEEEVGKLQICLEERNKRLMATSSSSEQYLKELDDLRSQLSFTQAAAEASAAEAQSAQTHCLSLLKELDEKNNPIKENEIRVNKLGEQLEFLQKDLQAREHSQNQHKDEVIRVEKESQAGERRNKVLKEPREQVAVKQQDKAGSDGKQNIWKSYDFRVIVSMSMLFLVAVTRR